MAFNPQRRARRLSMTSLIDVIFLLLLFFMLSSTFSKFAEIELAASGPGTGSTDRAIVFVHVTERGLTLNGKRVAPERLAEALKAWLDQDAAVLVSPARSATAQHLTDVLVQMRQVPGLPVSVLGAQ